MRFLPLGTLLSSAILAGGAAPSVLAQIGGERVFGGDSRGSSIQSSVLVSPDAFHATEDGERLLATGRTAEALEKFGAITGRLANRVVFVSRSPEGEPMLATEGKNYFGAWHMLLERLEALPAATQQEMERVDGPRARTALETALASGETADLIRVLRQYPWTRAGGDALVALGDRAFERGNLEEALAIFRRAARRFDRRDDPELLARITVLESSLAATRGTPPRLPELPSTSDPAVEIGGKTMPLSAVPKLPPQPLPAARPAQSFTTNTESLPPDPGRISSGIQWRKELEFEPRPKEHPFRPIYPVIAGESVFVSNGWAIAAFDRSTGVPLWREPVLAAGWEDVARSRWDDYIPDEDPSIALAPAIGQGIVVASLLVPRHQRDPFTFQGIPVYGVIPYRKLHAFDAATGAPLWNHWNPATARRSSAFIDNYRCAAPPVVAGDRALVPVWTVADDATVSLHLAAYALRTGEELWRTYLVTGQRPINMFGRSLFEYYCSPPTVDGDRVYMSTDLGIAASIDLTTGLVEWMRRYTSIEPPPSRSNAFDRPPVTPWAASPPALTEEYVVLTPTDSRFLYVLERRAGFEAATPVRSTQLDPSGRTPGVPSAYHLLGIVDNICYLSGRGVVALELPTGTGKPIRFRAASPSSTWLRTNEERLPRAAITKNAVLFPSEDGIAVLDRADLRLREMIPYRSGTPGGGDSFAGHIIASEGVLLTVSNPNVSAYFDANEVVASARRAAEASPTDTALRERFVRSLLGRGKVRARNKDYAAALEDYREADLTLAKLGGLEDLRASIQLALANAHDARGEAREALDAFRRAFEGARDGQLRRDAGLALERRLPAAAVDERGKVMVRLEREFGDAIVESKEYGRIPLSLYLCLRKAEALEAADAAAAVIAWQEAILRFADQWMSGGGKGTTTAEYARGRIAELIQLRGRNVYASVEAEARKRLEELGADPNPEDLATFAYRFPNSEVASEASCRHLEQLVAQGRHAEVPAATFEFLQREPSAPARRRALLANAAALRKLGNEVLASLLESSLGGGSNVAPTRSNISTKFGPRGPIAHIGVTSTAGVPEMKSIVNPGYNDGSAGEYLVGVCAGGDNLLSLRAFHVAQSSVTLLWERALETFDNDATRYGLLHEAAQGSGVALMGGIMSFCDGGAVVGVRIADGETIYRQGLGNGLFESALAVNGALVVARREEGANVIHVSAFEPISGVVLWESSFAAQGGPYKPTASATELAFLPTGSQQPRAAYRFAIATGESLPTVMLPGDWHHSSAMRAGLYGSVLVYVDNPVERERYDARIVALNLGDGGNKLWELSTNAATKSGYFSRAVLMASDEIYVLRLRQPGREGPPYREEPQLLGLDPKTGHQRVVARLPESARLAGVEYDKVIRRWTSPIVAVYSDDQLSTRLDIIDLRTGRAQTRSLQGSLITFDIPQPAVGEKLIAVAHCAGSKGRSGASRLADVSILRRDTLEYAVDKILPLSGQALDLAVTANAFVALSRQDSATRLSQRECKILGFVETAAAQSRPR